MHDVGILFPARHADFLGVADGNDAGRILKARGTEDRASRRSRGKQLQGLPAELGKPADRLRRRLASGDVIENVRARLREIDELGIDRSV